MSNNILNVSPSPHVKKRLSSNLMHEHMVVALLGIIVYASILNGYNVFLVALVSVASAFFSELFYNKIVYDKVGVEDWSCVVTALMFTCLVGENIPLYMPVVAMVFAIVVVKMVFGGFTNNMFIPSASALLFVMMVFKVMPNAWLTTVGTGFGVSPVENLVSGNFESFNILPFLYGNVTSAIGSISAIAVFAGIVYLVLFKVVRFRMPILAVAVYMFVAFCLNGFNTACLLPYLFSGNILFVSFYMLTDFTTSPNTVLGRSIYAIIFGVLSAIFIKLNLCGYAGTIVALIIVNCFTPLFDRIIRPRYFGEGK